MADVTGRLITTGAQQDEDRAPLADPDMKAEVEKQQQYPIDQLASDGSSPRAAEYQRLLDMAPNISRKPGQQTLRSVGAQRVLPRKHRQNDAEFHTAIAAQWLNCVAGAIPPPHLGGRHICDADTAKSNSSRQSLTMPIGKIFSRSLS